MIEFQMPSANVTFARAVSQMYLKQIHYKYNTYIAIWYNEIFRNPNKIKS